MATDWFQIVRRDGAQAIATLRGLDDINVRGDDGGNLLHAAIAYSNTDAALELIRRGIDVNAQDSKGKTPLHYSCDYQNAAIAESILEHGGDVEITDEHGNTPLWSAVFNARGMYAVVEVLICKGAGKVAGEKNKHGRSPIDFASQIGDEHLLGLMSAE